MENSTRKHNNVHETRLLPNGKTKLMTECAAVALRLARSREAVTSFDDISLVEMYIYLTLTVSLVSDGLKLFICRCMNEKKANFKIHQC